MIAVPELDGTTQARNRDEVELMAREYIALTIGRDDFTIAVTW